MGKDKQEILVMGELAAFLLAWVLGLVAALNGDSSHSPTGNDLAASGSYMSDSNLSDLLE